MPVIPEHRGDESGRPPILIVDDHAQVRKLLREWLQGEFPDRRWIEAASGEEAVAVAAAEGADLVLMDIDLPGINGIEAARRIKVALPHCHVIMLTIHEEAVFRAEAQAAGASGYVVKRRMHEELVPLLRRLLG